MPTVDFRLDRMVRCLAAVLHVEPDYDTLIDIFARMYALRLNGESPVAPPVRATPLPAEGDPLIRLIAAVGQAMGWDHEATEERVLDMCATSHHMAIGAAAARRAYRESLLPRP